VASRACPTTRSSCREASRYCLSSWRLSRTGRCSTSQVKHLSRAPWYIQHVGGTAVKDLTHIESAEERRQVLFDIFEHWAKRREELP
jgi:hypothetical protein